MEKTVETNHYGDVKVSGNEVDIIKLIEKIRNDLIKDFLDERFLKEYLLSKYHMNDISAVRVEFIRKDLKELFSLPVDTLHYQVLIDEIQLHERTSLAEGNEQLFYKEIETILQKYFYQ